MTYMYLRGVMLVGSAVAFAHAVAPHDAARIWPSFVRAAPAVILVEGPGLPRRVALVNRMENTRLFAAMTDAGAVRVAASPPPLRIALFWRAPVSGGALSAAHVDTLPFEDADQQGFLVPATRTSPPLLIIADDRALLRRTFRRIHEPGLAILSAHGIHLGGVRPP